VSPKKEPTVAELAQVPANRLGSRFQLGRQRPDVDPAVSPGTNQDPALALVCVDEPFPFPRLAGTPADVNVTSATPIL